MREKSTEGGGRSRWCWWRRRNDWNVHNSFFLLAAPLPFHFVFMEKYTIKHSNKITGTRTRVKKNSLIHHPCYSIFNNIDVKVYQVQLRVYGTFIFIIITQWTFLAFFFISGLPGFRRRNMVLQALEVIRIGLLFPLFSLCYIVAPHSSWGQTMRKPFIKFICHSASYFTFLCEQFFIVCIYVCTNIHMLEKTTTYN